MDSIGISNMAIGLVSGNQIMTFDDDTVESDACKTYYETARDFCLEARDWTFATARKRITPLTEAPVSEFSYSFKVPSDLLVTRQVCSDEAMTSKLVYQQEGRNIVCDSSIIYIRYTAKISDPTTFTPTFNAAVAHKLAEFISPILTANSGIKVALNQEATNLVDDGGAINGMQGSPKQVTASKLLRARQGYSYSQGIYQWGPM